MKIDEQVQAPVSEHLNENDFYRPRRNPFRTWKLPAKIALTLGCMLVLCYIVFVFNIPNPNMVLVTGLVIFSSYFGYPGGLTAAVIMMIYTLFFFSTDHSFIRFSEVNSFKTLISAIGIVIITFFVCNLKKVSDGDYEKLEYLAALLKEENGKLERSSSIDVLTGIRNRYSLRHHYTDYIKQDVFVMMIDIDNFKSLNDTYGHETGDDVLGAFGEALSAIFGQDHCYRYGGDEFLIVYPKIEHEAFRRLCDQLVFEISNINVAGKRGLTHFSAGYVYGCPKLHGELRQMFRDADQQLYAAKRAGKDKINGTAYEPHA